MVSCGMLKTSDIRKLKLSTIKGAHKGAHPSNSPGFQWRWVDRWQPQGRGKNLKYQHRDLKPKTPGLEAAAQLSELPPYKQQRTSQRSYAYSMISVTLVVFRLFCQNIL